MKTEERMHKIVIKGRKIMRFRRISSKKKIVVKTQEEHQEEEDRNILYGPKTDEYANK